MGDSGTPQICLSGISREGRESEVLSCQISDCQDFGGWGGGWMGFDYKGAEQGDFGDDGIVLCADCGGGYTDVCMHLCTNYIFIHM